MHNLTWKSTTHNVNHFLFWTAVVSSIIIILFLIIYYLDTGNTYCEDYDVICVEVSMSIMYAMCLIMLNLNVCRMMMNIEG